MTELLEMIGDKFTFYWLRDFLVRPDGTSKNIFVKPISADEIGGRIARLSSIERLFLDSQYARICAELYGLKALLISSRGASKSSIEQMADFGEVWSQLVIDSFAMPDPTSRIGYADLLAAWQVYVILIALEARSSVEALEIYENVRYLDYLFISQRTQINKTATGNQAQSRAKRSDRAKFIKAFLKNQEKPERSNKSAFAGHYASDQLGWQNLGLTRQYEFGTYQKWLTGVPNKSKKNR